MHHRPSLRERLHEPGLLAAVGAHDALSATLIEEAGFDAIWAGGFGISATQKCVPDASGLTMTETLDVSKNLADAANIPVIVDGDTGYGNAINVMRTVADFEKAGIAKRGIRKRLRLLTKRLKRSWKDWLKIWTMKNTRLRF